MNKLLLLLIFCTVPVLLMAGRPNGVDTAVAPSLYVENLNRNMTLKLSVNNNIELFEVNSYADSYVLRPNVRLNTRLSVNYRFVGFSVGFSPDFLPGNNDDSLKGKSKWSSFGMTFYHKNWIQNLTYSKTSGFYLQNTDDFVVGWIKGKDAYFQYPELVYTSYFGLTAYKTNPDYSLRALSDQTERQLKNAGSFLPLLWYRYYIIDDQTVLTGQNSSQKSDNFEAIGQVGYFYSFVFHEKFYVSPGMAVGGGMIYTKLLTRLPTENVYTKSSNPIFRMEGQIAAGYNARRIFAGLQMIGRWERYSQGESTSTIVYDALTYQVYVGYRFNSPKSTDRLLDRVPLMN